MAIGLDSGEGLASFLFVSDDPRAGMFTTLASFLATVVASCAVLVVGVEYSKRFYQIQVSFELQDVQR